MARNGISRIPRMVDLASSLWNWHVDSVEGEQIGEEFVFASTGPHKVYTVLAHPVEPWKRANGDPQSAWTLALDRACEWAKGATTTNAALAAVTRNLFSRRGWTYDLTFEPNFYKGPEGLFSRVYFDLSGYLLDTTANRVNCLDQANGTYLLGNLLGADVRVKLIDPFGHIKHTMTLVGGESTSCFGDFFDIHYFTMCEQLVFDSCVGPVLGAVGLQQYIEDSIDSTRTPHGTVGDVVEDGGVDDFQ